MDIFRYIVRFLYRIRWYLAILPLHAPDALHIYVPSPFVLSPVQVTTANRRRPRPVSSKTDGSPQVLAGLPGRAAPGSANYLSLLPELPLMMRFLIYNSRFCSPFFELILIC